MPSITRRRSQDPGRRASAEAALLAATTRLLINGANFTELGVQEIATEAGVARSTFYVHFQDKTDLLARLAVTTVDLSFNIASAWTPADGVDGMADAFLQVLGIYREHASVLRAVTEVASYDTTIRDFWRRGHDRFTDRTIAVLREEVAAGRAPADADMTAATRIVVVGGQRAIFDHIMESNPADDASFARELALIWWHGVYRRPAD